MKDPKGECRVGNYARVTSVTHHARTSYSCVAISAKASCHCFIAEAEVQTAMQIQNLWERVADSIIPIVQYGTHGNKRRDAAYCAFTGRVPNAPSFR